MRNRFTALIQKDGKWFTSSCPEIPEANGQGRTRETCLSNLVDAVELVLDYRRERALKKAPKGSEKTAILV